MEGCEKVVDRLLDFIDGELAAGEYRRIEAHLSRCPRCFQEARELRETLGRVQALPEPAVPDGLLDDLASAVQRRIAHESRLRLPFWRRTIDWLSGHPGLRPLPALSAAAALGLLLAIGLARTPHAPQSPPIPEGLIVGDSLSIAQNLDILEQFDVLEDLDVLEQLPLLRRPENGQPQSLS